MITSGFTAIEKQAVDQDLSRIRDALYQTVANIHIKSADWGNWDDVYVYMKDHNPKFIDQNVTEKSTQDMDLHLMVFVDPSKSFISGIHFPYGATKSESAIQSAFISVITDSTHRASIQAADGAASGIILLQGHPMIISSRPIHNSEGTGESRGQVIFGRYIDESLIKRLQDTTHYSFTLGPVDQRHGAMEQTIDQNGKLTGYVTLLGMDGSPVGEVKATFPRTIYDIGRTSAMNYLFAMLFLGVCILVVLRFELSFFVMNPLKRLMDELMKIAERRSFSDRVSVHSKDEIGTVSQMINQMLTELSSVQTRMEEKQKELELSTDDLSKQIAVVSEQNQEMEQTKKAMLNLLTDTQQLEKQLEREKEQAQAIISSMGDGLLVIDPTFDIVMVNPQAIAMFGTSEHQILHTSLLSLYSLTKASVEIPSSDRPLMKTIQNGVVESADLDDDIVLHVVASGRSFPVAFTVTPLQMGSGRGAVVVLRDITESVKYRAQLIQAKELVEKEVEERTSELQQKNTALVAAQQKVTEGWMQLEREKARLTASMHGLTLGFIITDPDGRILIINAMASTILGVSQTVDHIEHIEQLFTQPFNLADAIRTCRETNKPVNVPELGFHSKYLRLFVAPILVSTNNNEYAGTVLIIEDITEAKVIERSKEEFFSIASHELRTPLTAIRGNTSIIMDMYKDKFPDAEFGEMLDDIHVSSIRLIGIVNDFLNMSRLEQGRMNYHIGSFDLSKLIHEVMEELHSSADEKQLIFTDTVPLELPLVQGDKDRTKEVLINLISNSIKYTETGSVTVGVELVDGMVTVLVTDTGRGISEQNRSLLFRKFQQAGDSILTRDTSKSTGLGLYISKLMTEGMGGSIGLRSSQEGVGSVFFFSLKVA
jgi:PAS domain S-box-containing protein